MTEEQLEEEINKIKARNKSLEKTYLQILKFRIYEKSSDFRY